jgi:adenosylhomocysteine nucleosidase
MSGAVSSARFALLFALREEAAPFLRRLGPRRAEFVIEISGMGTANAARRVRAMGAPRRPAGLLICGFAAGLQAPPGSLVVARSVGLIASASVSATYLPDSRLLGRCEAFVAEDNRRRPQVAPIVFGLLATAPQVLTTSAQKQTLQAQTGAVAADMETAGAAQAAQEMGIPWLAVRAITDGVEDDLPFDFNALADANGHPHHGRIVSAALARPRQIPALIRLGRRSSLAAGNLAGFLEAFLNTRPEEVL